jgi:serine/threonine protein kinase
MVLTKELTFPTTHKSYRMLEEIKGIDFISRLMTRDVAQRMTAEQALVHPFLVDCE